MISNRVNFIMMGVLLSLFSMTDCKAAAAAKAPPPPVMPRCPSLDDLFRMPNPEGALQNLKIEKPHCIAKLCKEIDAENFFQRAQNANVPTLMSRKMGFFCANVDPEWARLQGVHQGEKPSGGGPAFPKLRPLSPKPARAPSPGPALPALKSVPTKPAFNLPPLEAERIEVARSELVDLPELPMMKRVDSRHHVSQVPVMHATQETRHLPRDFEAERRELERQRHAAEEEAQRQGRLQGLRGQFADLNDRLRRAEENYNNLTIAVMILKEDLSSLERSGTAVLYGFSARASQDKDPQTYMTELAAVLKDRRNNRKLTPDGLAQINTGAHLLREAEDNLREARTDLARINQELMQSTTA